MLLCQLSKVKPFLSQSNFQTVIHAFVTTTLDYCNSLYYSVSQSLLFCLQLVQNTAPRLLSGTRKYDAVTPILSALHWLPIKFRIDFKILLFVYKALNNLAPQYLTDLLWLSFNKYCIVLYCIVHSERSKTGCCFLLFLQFFQYVVRPVMVFWLTQLVIWVTIVSLHSAWTHLALLCRPHQDASVIKKLWVWQIRRKLTEQRCRLKIVGWKFHNH